MYRLLRRYTLPVHNIQLPTIQINANKNSKVCSFCSFYHLKPFKCTYMSIPLFIITQLVVYLVYSPFLIHSTTIIGLILIPNSGWTLDSRLNRRNDNFHPPPIPVSQFYPLSKQYLYDYML